VSDLQPTSVERMVRKGLADDAGVGRPLSNRVRHLRRTMEGYLKAGAPPRWMERISEIDRRLGQEKRSLAEAYAALQRECGRDGEAFEQRWRALAEERRFDDLNELIRQHNDWYPIERDLPMDPRTRDYIQLHGRSYRRPELGPRWILEQFPASPGSATTAPYGAGAACRRVCTAA
jgi:hypothetical protein